MNLLERAVATDQSFARDVATLLADLVENDVPRRFRQLAQIGPKEGRMQGNCQHLSQPKPARLQVNPDRLAERDRLRFVEQRRADRQRDQEIQPDLVESSLVEGEEVFDDPQESFDGPFGAEFLPQLAL